MTRNTADGTNVPEIVVVQRKDLRRIVIASSIGTVIEYFDFALYGAATALVFGPLFFPTNSELTSLLASFGVFAAAFIVRPIGGIIASNIGDRIGRKPILIATIALMGFATVATGLLPTAATIGAWAPVLLITTRVLQGLGAGAEYAGAVTAVSEYTPDRHRALFTSFGQASQGLAVALATLTFALLSLLPSHILLGWAWRLPFLFSAVLFAVALYIRRHIEETPEFAREQERAKLVNNVKRSVPLVEAIREVPKSVLVAILCGSGINVCGYLNQTFSISYITNTLEMSPIVGTVAVVIATGLSALLIPLFAAIADRIGYWNMFFAGAVGQVLYAYPMFLLLDSRNTALTILAPTIGYGVLQSMALSSQAAFMSDLFLTRYRFSGIAVGREINVALLGGTTPFIATALVAAAGGAPTYVIVFVVCAQLLAIVGLLLSRSIRIPKEVTVVLAAESSR